MKVQEILFKSSPKPSIFIYTVLTLVFSLNFIPVALAERVTHYKTYHPGTGEEFNRFYYSIHGNQSGGYQVKWGMEEGGSTAEEDYTLDEYFQTVAFRVVNIKEGTDYIGERKESSIFIRGRFKGEDVERTMDIDERPFYFNPKIGLTAFVRSGEGKGKFWGFQNKELKAYPMKATNEGPEIITVNGKKVEAIKIFWTVDDFRSAFFKRVYWFRKSDGLYLKQKTDGGKLRELVSEEGEL